MTKEEFYALIKEYYPQPMKCPLDLTTQHQCHVDDNYEMDKLESIYYLLTVNLHSFVKAAQNLIGLMELDTKDVVNFIDVVKVYPFEDTFEEVVHKIAEWADVYDGTLSRMMWKGGK